MAGGVRGARASAALRPARFDCTAAIPPATSARTRSTAAPPSTIRSRRISRACARARSTAALTLGLGVVARAASRNSPLGLGEGGAAAALPLQGPGQPDAAVQLAVWAPQGVPGVGGGGEVVQDPLAFDVVVEPAAQPGPGAGQRLVGDLDDAVVAGDQPGADEPLDSSSWAGWVTTRSARQPDRLGSPSVPGVTRRSSRSACWSRWSGSSSPYRDSADCATAPRIRRRLVAGDGEGPPLAPPPQHHVAAQQHRAGAPAVTRLCAHAPPRCRTRGPVQRPSFPRVPPLVRGRAIREAGTLATGRRVRCDVASTTRGQPTRRLARRWSRGVGTVSVSCPGAR